MIFKHIQVISLFKTILNDQKKARPMESTGGMHPNLLNTYLRKRIVNFWGEDS